MVGRLGRAKVPLAGMAPVSGAYLVLLLNESSPATSPIIGHEKSPVHGKTRVGF